MGNNLKLKREAKNKSWPYIKAADKLSFLDSKVNVNYNLYDIVGQSILSAYEGKLEKQKLSDMLNLDIDVKLGSGYGLGLSYRKGAYGAKLTKDF